jgi:hypothetical protein
MFQEKIERNKVNKNILEINGVIGIIWSQFKKHALGI